MGFGSCTVLIFSCPASALGLGGPPFCHKVVLTLTLQHVCTVYIVLVDFTAQVFDTADKINQFVVAAHGR